VVKTKLNKMKKPIFNAYADAIAKQFHFSLQDMFNQKNKGEFIDARQMLYYLCKERPMRLSYIQKFLAESGYHIGHSTILSGYERAKKLVDTDPDFKKAIIEIQKAIPKPKNND
tara:strand:+ start:240 stop:581 length:342 start_codon:yes stop_codon:yes gene_type:complete